MKTFVVDTHALAWFLAEDKRLSPAALRVLSNAEKGDAQVLVPTLVLAELMYIAERQRVPVTLQEALSRIEESHGFAIVPFDLVCLQGMLTLPDSWDIHDRVIAATAKFYEAVLISRDEILQESDEIEVLW
jgi:predicted nucleic acid-binding protein